MPMVTCQNCGREFRVPPSTLARGSGKYCSRACFHVPLIYLNFIDLANWVEVADTHRWPSRFSHKGLRHNDFGRRPGGHILDAIVRRRGKPCDVQL